MRKTLLLAFTLSLFWFCPETIYSQEKKSIDQYIDEGFASFSNFISDIIFFSPVVKNDIIYGEVGENEPGEKFYQNLPFEVSFENSGNKIPYGEEIHISYAAEDSFALAGMIGGHEIKLVETYLQTAYNIDGFIFKLKFNKNSPYPIEPGRVYTFKPVIFRLPPIPVILLIGIAIYLSIYFGFINFGKFGLAWGILRNQYLDRYGRGPLSHFQSLSTALSGSLGLGNIAGVGVAIALGGAGAVFWMILAGIFAMAVKFTSATLSLRYREYDKTGVSYGGPMYYLQKGFEEKGHKKFGKGLAICFSILCIVTAWGIGNMFQINQIYQQLILVGGEASTIIDQYKWIGGILFGGLITCVLVGGIRRIAWLTERLVPAMSLIYICGTLWVIGSHISALPSALLEIVLGAFIPMSVVGGVMGTMIQGLSAAIFSNEAGLGSSSIAHSSSGTRDAASHGLVAMLEPFIDTVIICTLTALSIIIKDAHYDINPTNGLAMAAAAFQKSLPFSEYMFTFVVVLFAFSSMIAWGYYGLKAWEFLFGKDKRLTITYYVVYTLCIVIGSMAPFSTIINFSRAMMFAIAFPHLIGLVVLAPDVREELTKYVTKIQRGDIKRRK